MYGFWYLYMVDRIKKFLKNTKRIWPKLDLRVSAKSGKVNFEKCDYNRSRSEIFKIVSNSLKITTSLWAYWSFIFKWQVRWAALLRPLTCDSNAWSPMMKLIQNSFKIFSHENVVWYNSFVFVYFYERKVRLMLEVYGFDF